MDLVTDFTVEDIFLIPNRGVIVTGTLRNDEEHGFKAGATVKIVRPDGTAITGMVRGVDDFQTVSGIKMFGLLIGETITKEDVPRGSKISISE